MADKLLGRLTVKHRGVPVGTIEVIERDRDQPIEPLLPAELRDRLDRSTVLWSRVFAPFQAFAAAVAPLRPHVNELRLANDQWRSLLAEPPSEINRALANAAWARITAAEAQLDRERVLIEQDLELWDEEGHLVPALISVDGLEPPSVYANFDDAPAAVVAQLRQLPRRSNEEL